MYNNISQKKPHFRNTDNWNIDSRTEKPPLFNNGIPGKCTNVQGGKEIPYFDLDSSLFPSPHPSLNPLPSHLHISTSLVSSSLPPSNLSLSQHLLGLRSCLEFLQCQYYMCACERVENCVSLEVYYMYQHGHASIFVLVYKTICGLICMRLQIWMYRWVIICVYISCLPGATFLPSPLLYVCVYTFIMPEAALLGISWAYKPQDLQEYSRHTRKAFKFTI